MKMSLTENPLIHSGAYFFKAGILDNGRPKFIFASEGHPDIEITISDDGRLTLRKARIENATITATLGD